MVSSIREKQLKFLTEDLKIPEEIIYIGDIELFCTDERLRFAIQHGYHIESKPELTDENYQEIFKPIYDKNKQMRIDQGFTDEDQAKVKEWSTANR